MKSVTITYITCILLFAIIGNVYADHRPIEASWKVENSVHTDKMAFPPTYYVLQGDVAVIKFLIDENDIQEYINAEIRQEISEHLNYHFDELLLESKEYGLAYAITPQTKGIFPIKVTLSSNIGDYTLEYSLMIKVISALKEIPEARVKNIKPDIAEVSPGPIDADGNNHASENKAATDYGHIYGFAATYSFPDGNRYMLRGVRLELYETGGSWVKTVYSSDDIGEGNCGIDYEDYISSTNVWHHVSESGRFDFGEVYVGPSGKDFQIREIFRFYSGADGSSTTGTERTRIMDGDNSNDIIMQVWNVGHVDSGEEQYVGLYSSSWTLSSGNGRVADEAMHALFDIARQYRYFEDCTGYYIPYVACYIRLSDTGSPYHSYGTVNFGTWDNGYMADTITDSIRHEYAHAIHYNMRGGAWDLRPPGDTNHGNCANSTSVDAVIEGFARWVPPLIYRDGVYHWTATSTRTMSGSYDYCTAPTPDDRHEWAYGRALWQGWDEVGQTNAYANCTTDSFRVNDPIYVEDAFNFFIDDCGYDHEIWTGFDNNSINYDVTAPSNPSPITVSPNARWTNDTTPTWSWSTPYDDISGVDGYSITVSNSIGIPNATKDIEEVTNYTPSALADHSFYYFNIRPVDYAGNWSGSYSSKGPIGVDTVQPGTISSLSSTSHTIGHWSNDTSVDMSWTLATDDRSGVDGYGITTATGTYLPIPVKDIENVSTCTESGLSTSSSGWYVNIRSVDNAGNWDNDYVSSGPYYIETTLPSAVSGLTSTSHTPNVWSNDTTIDFTWTAASDTYSGLDGYGLYWSSGTSGSPSAEKDIEAVTSYTQVASTDFSGHYFNIRSVDEAGNWQSGYESIGPFYIETENPPGVTDLTSTSHAIGEWSNEMDVDFTWTASVDTHSGVDGYGLFWSSGSPGLPSTSKDIEEVTTFTQSTTSSNSARYFCIRAKDNAGNWQNSYESVGPYYVEDILPSAVSGLSSTSHTPNVWSNDTTIDFNWTAATDSYSGVDGYGLFWSTSVSGSPGMTKDIEEVTSYVQTATSSSTGYYFKLRTVDNAGNWQDGYEYVGPFLVETVLPAGVTNLTSTSHTPNVWSNDTSIDFSWNAATDSWSGIDGYGIFWSTSSSSPPSTYKDIEEVTAFTQNSSSSSSGYYFKMRSVDNAGNWQSDFEIVGPYLIDKVNPMPPTNLNSITNPVNSCITDDPWVTITWDAASDTYSGLKGYSYVFFNATPDTAFDIDAADVSLTANIGYSKTARYLSIHAGDFAGNWSTVATYGPFTIDNSPSPIGDTLVATNPGGGEVALEWANTGEAEYMIERSTDSEFSMMDTFTTTSESWTDVSPPISDCIYYRIKGVNACGVLGS